LAVRGSLVLAAIAATLPLAGLAQPSPAVYDVPAPASHARLPDGWGLAATVRGRTMDLGARDDGWADDPRVPSRDIEAGYGWRGRAVSALVGYDQHDFGPTSRQTLGPAWRDAGDPHPAGDSGVLGLSLVVHAR
jgi:hypothetical protein